MINSKYTQQLNGKMPQTKQLSGSVRVTGGSSIKSYNELLDKPSINNIELNGNKTLEELGIQKAGNYLTLEDIDELSLKATDIMFDSNLILTAPIGVHTIPSSGSKTLGTAGKNLKQVLDMLVAEEKNPLITQPSVGITLNGAGVKEAGTMFTPSYSASLNPGSYQYGPATNVVDESWQITDTNSNNSATNTGYFAQFQVVDGTNYKVNVTVQHSGGDIPVTNLGNPYANGAIQSGSKTTSSSTVTAYRNCFYGSTNNKNSLDSETIRSLTGKSNREATNGSTYNVSVPVGALQVIIAYKSSLRDITSALDVNGLNAQIVGSFKKQLVQVSGANNYNPIEYKVFTLEFANPNNTQNIIKITI